MGNSCREISQAGGLEVERWKDTSALGLQRWFANRIGPARSASYFVAPFFRSMTLNFARLSGMLSLDAMPVMRKMYVSSMSSLVATMLRSGLSDPGNLVEPNRMGESGW